MSMIINILEHLMHGESSITEIKDKLNFNEPILPYLLWLEKMGFVNRKLIEQKQYELISSRWSITSQGKAYLEFIKKNKELPREETIPTVNLVCTIPVELKESDIFRYSAVLVDVVEDILLSAKKEVIITSPYIDQTAIPFIKKINKNVKIKILTEKISTDLERLKSTNKNIVIKKLKKIDEKTRVQLYQVHAKFICVDDSVCLVMSANIKATSLYHNFEVGIMTKDKNIITSLKTIFEILYSKIE